MQPCALEKRGQIFREVRSFFYGQGFLEVETPLLLPANAPEEHIDPLFAGGMQLQTSPELCMKRLLCRGHRKIFQISRCWRADERGSRHLPEFTMLEWYRADSDYNQLMHDCINLLCHVASTCIAGSVYRSGNMEIDPLAQWENITVHDAFTRFAGVDPLTSAENGTFDEVLVTTVEPALARFTVPVILHDYPASMAALSRLKTDDCRFAERFELYLGGLELANGFSELNDPVEQLKRFQEANRLRQTAGRSNLPIPSPFLSELPQMPPSAGIALGMDRLVMLATGAPSIDHVVAFTPEML